MPKYLDFSIAFDSDTTLTNFAMKLHRMSTALWMYVVLWHNDMTQFPTSRTMRVVTVVTTHPTQLKLCDNATPSAQDHPPRE